MLMMMVSHLQGELFKLYRHRATKICLAGVFFWTAFFSLILASLFLVKEYISAQIGGNEFSVFQLDIGEFLRFYPHFSGPLPASFYQGQWFPYILYQSGYELADVIIIVCLASMLDLGRCRGMVRLLLGHGVHRAQYVLVQGLALLLYLLGFWTIIVFAEALLSQMLACVHGYPGWQIEYLGDVARVVGGHALWHFVLAGVIYLTVAVFHSPVIGALGGLVYRFFIQDQIYWQLKYSAWPHLVRYTPECASELLLDRTVLLSGGEAVLWGLLIFVWGAAFFALATLIFEKRDFV